MHFYKYFTAMFVALAMVVLTIPTLAADFDAVDTATGTTTGTTIETTADTDTIDDTSMLAHELLWDGEVPADIRWKTRQDKGQWIEELDAVDGANSLILVVNSLDKVDTNALPTQEVKDKSDAEDAGEFGKPMTGINEPDGLSTLMYLSKNAEGEWLEIFSVDCKISGGELFENEAIYGVYSPVKAFGNQTNPGSLLPYRELTGDDYWILNPKEELFGDIHTIQSSADKVAGAVNLKAMKVFFNYGMIVKSKSDENECTTLLLNCYQSDSKKDQFAGIQIPEESLRMLVQCADEETCVIIVGSVDELENL